MEKVDLIPPAEITEKSCWVVELEEEIMKEVKTSGRSSPVVFSMGKALLASYQKFYIPSLISIGPYHFGRTELSSMEPHKTEAVRRMQDRIHGRSMQSIVETEIMAIDKSIREFYDKELSYSAIDLAWMVTKDSCFVFEFLLNYIRKRRAEHEFHNECVVEGKYDAVFSSSVLNPTWRNIFYDLALFENQIPLSVLQRLLTIAYSKSYTEEILGDIFSGVVSRNLIFRWGMPRPYEIQKTLHFLEGLYYRHVGWELSSYEEEAYSLRNRRLLHFVWIESIFTCCCSRQMRARGFEDHVRPFTVKLPSATTLQKKGVKFCAVTSTNSTIQKHPQGIRWVQFDEITATLYLPEVRIDRFRHALLRNFIALEYNFEKYQPAPITSFAFFMGELVECEEDVALLREANVIKNVFGSNKELAQCLNHLTSSYHKAEGCKPIDDARVGLDKYLRRKYKILWKEFLSTYFVKPWLVAGSVGATLLLLMTLLQVFCLFYTCNRTT